MKKYILLIIIVTIECNLFAQLEKPRNNTFYAKLAYAHGTHFTYGASLHHANKRGFLFSVQLFIENRDANNIPDDFEPGGLFGGTPFNSIESIGIQSGKTFLIEGTTTQVNLAAGVNVGSITRPKNFKKQSTRSLLITPDNYSYELEKKPFIGLVINPNIQLNISKYFGFTFGIRTNINHQDITAGFELGILLGYLRGITKNKYEV